MPGPRSIISFFTFAATGSFILLPITKTFSCSWLTALTIDMPDTLYLWLALTLYACMGLLDCDDQRQRLVT